MDSQTIAKRYAEGFMRLIQSAHQLEPTLDELLYLRLLLRENPSFFSALKNPIVPLATKNSIIDQVLQQRFSDGLRNFLKFLTYKRRIDLLPFMLEYIRVQYANGQEIEAIVRVSFPLHLETLQSIKTSLEKSLKRRLKLYVHLDANLLGGVQVKVNNRLIDYSLANSLKELKERLLNILFH